MALFFRANDLASSDLLLAGSLVPIVVAIGVSALSSDEGLSFGALWPGLAASAALLLLFPQPRIHSISGAMVLVLLPVLTGAGAVFLRDDTSDSWTRVVALFGACLVFATATLISLGSAGNLSWLAVAFDAVSLPCTLLALSRVGPMRYASLFVVVPLCLLLYGFVLLRPQLNMREVAGIVLLIASAVALLRYRDGGGDGKPLRLVE